MNEKRKHGALTEFSVVALLIAVAVFFALNINVNVLDKKYDQHKNSPAGSNKTGDKWSEGKALFKSNCAACHNPFSDGTGPALKGARGRWKAAGDYQGKTGEQWLKMWVKNWNDPVNANYKYAVDMANSRVAQMNSFPFLKDEEIDEILQYVDSTSSVNSYVAN